VIKAIIFDCFGVLTEDLWKEFTATLPANQKLVATQLNRALDSGQLSHNDFYSEIYELTGRKPQEVENIINSSMQKNQPLLEYIATLKPTYKTCILSNISSDWITKRFLSEEEAALFDKIFLSFEIGYTKPDKEAFEVCLKLLNVNADQTVLIDDSVANCDGAEKVGMRAILYTDFQAFKKQLEKILTLKPRLLS